MQDQTIIMMVGAFGFLINIVVLAGGGVWKLSRVEASIRESMSDHREDMDKELGTVRREFGEVATALRQKIHEVETWSRDEFVRKKSFDVVIDGLRGDLKSIGDKIEARLLRMEGKIDRQGGVNT